MEIRGKTISYSSYRRKERDKIERDLLKDIDTLECNVSQLLELEFITFVHGKGLWKFSNSLLYDLEYSNIVKKKRF